MVSPVKYGLPPVARSDARLFILGSLPGDASLAERQYYAHPRNAFWLLVGRAVGEELAQLPYGERLERLQAHRIGLWDVVAHATRRGSLDQSIREAGHNPLADFLAGFADLEAVAFNGTTAAAIGRRVLSAADGLALIDLPSSSPANTRPLEQKAVEWARIARYCGP